jgi:carbamoyltransferase
MRQLFEWDPDIGYRYIPGLKARIMNESGGYLIRANQMGFRSQREFITEKNLGKCRILLFGDSYTAGDGVSIEKRYSDLLEKLIPDLEVYNFGLPGTGTDQQYLAYRKFASGIDHDAIMIVVLIENIRRIVSRYRYYLDENGAEVCYAKPYFELSGGELTLRHVPPKKEPVRADEIPLEDRPYVGRTGRFPKIREILIRTKLEKLAHTFARFTPYPEYNSPEHPAWRLMEAILERWIKEQKKPVLLVPLPQYYFIEELSAVNYHKRFSNLALKTGCACFDPLPDLKRYSMEERRGFRFARDVHYSPAGHAAIAQALAPAVRKVLEGAR